MRQIKYKISGATLPEVLISLVIILAVFTISFSIYTRIVTSGTSVARTKAFAEMKRMMTESEQNQDFNGMEAILDEITYQKTVMPYLDFQDLSVISIQAIQQGDTLGNFQKIIRKIN